MAFCTECGASLKDGAKFCTSCGKAFEASDTDNKTTEHAEEVNTTEEKNTVVDEQTVAQQTFEPNTQAPTQTPLNEQKAQTNQVYSKPIRQNENQQTYTPPPYRQAEPPRYEAALPMQNNKSQIVSTGLYILAFLLNLIPVIGLIVYIIWACGGTKKESLRNFAKAYLILLVIGIALSVIFALIAYLFFRDYFISFFEYMNGDYDFSDTTFYY